MQDGFVKTLPEGLPLAFSNVLVIVGGGRVDADLLLQLVADGAAVVAADGGAYACLEAGVTPMAIIGDMDSADPAADWGDKIKVFHLDEQLTTDFEKCLYCTKAPLTIGLGMTGGRLDHTLAALDAMARHVGDRSIVLVDEEDLTLGVRGAFTCCADIGERISVHPIEPVLFRRSTGLSYPLDGLMLAPGVRTGTSNAASAKQVVIEPEAGEDGFWLVLLNKERLPDLMAHMLG